MKRSARRIIRIPVSTRKKQGPLSVQAHERSDRAIENDDPWDFELQRRQASEDVDWVFLTVWDVSDRPFGTTAKVLPKILAKHQRLRADVQRKNRNIKNQWWIVRRQRQDAWFLHNHLWTYAQTNLASALTRWLHSYQRKRRHPESLSRTFLWITQSRLLSRT